MRGRALRVVAIFIKDDKMVLSLGGNVPKVTAYKRFAAAVMYVEQQVYDLKDDSLLCVPDEIAGQFLFGEIMRAGNFGQYDERLCRLV